MKGIEHLKKELQRLKSKQTERTEIEKIKFEIRQLKRHEKATEYRKKHPIMTGISDATIKFGKKMTEPQPQIRIKNLKKTTTKKIKTVKSDIQNLIDNELKL